MSDPLTRPRAQMLNEQILASNTYANMRLTAAPAEHWPSWYREVLAKLDLIGRVDKILYVSSSLTMDSPAGGGVFALTETLVISVSVTGVVKGDWGEVTATVWRRSDLRELGILRADEYSAFENRDSPDSIYFQLELHYRDRPVIKIPLGDRPGRDAARAIAETYPDLLKDISMGN